MTALTPHARAQLWRLARLPAVTAAAAAAITPLIQPLIVRWPAIGLFVALAEVVYHELTRPADTVTPGPGPATLPIIPEQRTPPA